MSSDAGALAAVTSTLSAFNVESFTLLGIALAVTFWRLYVRISSIGLKNLWADDYLVVVGAIFYATETGLAYAFENKAQGLANSSITDEQRAGLQSSDIEYQTRILGSKIQLCCWVSYSSLLWALKGAMCTFYYRLTKHLKGYRQYIYFGFVLIGVSWLLTMLNLLLSCRPFHHMWQIYPNPGIYCQPSISPALVWTYLGFDVASYLYLIAIPIPMLYKGAMPILHRIWFVALLSCGLFVTMAAILRVVLLVSDPVDGTRLAGSWAIRESFVAVVTTNLPLLSPHFKCWISLLLSSIRKKPDSSERSDSESTQPTPESQRNSRRLSADPTADKCSESEKRILDGSSLTINDALSSPSTAEVMIERQLEVSVVEEDALGDSRCSNTKSGNYTSTWSGNVADGKPAARSQYFGDHIHQSTYRL